MPIAEGVPLIILTGPIIYALIFFVFRPMRNPDIKVPYFVPPDFPSEGKEVHFRILRYDIKGTQIMASEEEDVCVYVFSEWPIGRVLCLKGRGHRILDNDINGYLLIRLERSEAV